MEVQMDEWMDGWMMDGWMDGCINGWMMDGWIDGCNNGWIDGQMDGQTKRQKE